MTLTEDYAGLVVLMESGPWKPEFQSMEKWLKNNKWIKQPKAKTRRGYTSTWLKTFFAKPGGSVDAIERVLKFRSDIKGQFDHGRLPLTIGRVRVYNNDTRRMNTLLRIHIEGPPDLRFGTISLRDPNRPSHRPKSAPDPRQQHLP